MIPRKEYPRPQFERDDSSWINLNGKWDFQFDFGKSGDRRGMQSPDAKFEQKITVPFCPESELSGIGYKDFIPSVWYRKVIEIPEAWDNSKGRVLIHFGASDYETDVWADGVFLGRHKGGYSSFTFELKKDQAKPGKHTVTVWAKDDTSNPSQPSGKQSPVFESFGCFYTRTTGIWQTVWLEYVPETYIERAHFTTDTANGTVTLDAAIYRYVDDGSKYELKLDIFDRKKLVSSKTVNATWRNTRISQEMTDYKLWEPGKPFLYDAVITLYKDGKASDTVRSYFGMRSVSLTKGAILINGKPVFQRLILDQGFYPDGIYTASSDRELKADIERSMAYGFNGARLHQKVFEERFLYWADRLGYLCWGEHGNWGYSEEDDTFLGNYVREWSEIVERDYSHPSIIGWCPFNETGSRGGNTIGIIYDLTKRLDQTRPVIDSSGWFHHFGQDGRPGTDVYDFHDYEQNTEQFRKNIYSVNDNGAPHAPVTPKENWHPDTPYFCSEFGGTAWCAASGWGYGQGPESEEEFIERFGGRVTALLTNPNICAFCYTQLTDVEQEQNGLYTYDRKPKFPHEVLRKFMVQKAAIEE